jgi:nitroreductase
MKTLEAIETRRSIKQYDPEHKLTEEEINKLFSAAILSPTSFNIQNWRFLAVTDQAIKDKLKAASWNQEQISNCSLLIVICADLKAWAKNPERYWKNAPEAAQQVLVPMIGKFYTDNEELQRDEAMRSGGMAAQTIMLLAKEMGYDTNPMIGFDPNEVGKIINLPEDHVIVMMIPVGKAIQDPKPRGGQLSFKEVLFFDQF